MKLHELIDEYITHRKSLGEKFETNQRILKSYVKFMGRDLEHDQITEEKNIEFLSYPSGTITAHWFVKHTALRGLFLWCLTRSYLDYFPVPTEIPKRLEHIPAYIYNHEELKALFTCEVRSRLFYDECVQMILKLTYALGLRISETIALELQDIDFTQNVVRIRETKFYKSRLCPFNEQVKNSLMTFFNWRKSNNMPQRKDSHLFLNKNGGDVILDSFQHLFIRIRKIVGLDNVVAGRFKPRLHDLRHTFAVNRLRCWYAAGENVQVLLPVLSTYLGHKTLAYTAVYLTMTPELLTEVNKRFVEYVNPKDYTHEDK